MSKRIILLLIVSVIIIMACYQASTGTATSPMQHTPSPHSSSQIDVPKDHSEYTIKDFIKRLNNQHNDIRRLQMQQWNVLFVVFLALVVFIVIFIVFNKRYVLDLKNTYKNKCQETDSDDPDYRDSRFRNAKEVLDFKYDLMKHTHSQTIWLISLVLIFISYMGYVSIDQHKKDIEQFEKETKENIQEMEKSEREKMAMFQQDAYKDVENIRWMEISANERTSRYEKYIEQRSMEFKINSDEVTKRTDEANKLVADAEGLKDELNGEFDKFINEAGKKVDDEVQKLQIARELADQGPQELTSAQKKELESIVIKILAIPENHRTAIDYFLMANNSEDLDEQIRLYTLAIEIDPNFSFAYYNRGSVYNNMGKYNLAIKDLDKAIEINPNYAVGYLGRGITNNNLGEYDLAINDCNKSVQLDPNSVEAYFVIGNAYLGKKEFDIALKYYDKSIKLDPNYELPYYNKACTFVLRNSEGDIERAFEMLNMAAEKGFDNVGLVEIAIQFNTLKGDPRFEEFMKKVRENKEKKRNK
jgi:tetratricopeptide (TPR) repeat protein